MNSNQKSKRRRSGGNPSAPAPTNAESSGSPQINRSKPGRGSSSLIVKLSDEKAKTNYVGPALVKFPDIIPPPATPFVLYGNKTDEKATKILAGETGQLEFESSRDTGHESACTYLMGIRSSSANTLTLFPTTFYEMRPKVKQLKDAVRDREQEAEEEDAQQKYNSSRTALGTTFGSKKARRAIQAAARNAIDPESMLHLQSHLTEAITNSSTTLPTAAQQAAEADIDRPIPPFNRDATSPKEVYNLSDVVSNIELNSVPLANITGCHSAQAAIRMLPNSRSAFVNQRIGTCWSRFPDGILNKKEEQRLRILIYISYLLQLTTNRKWTKEHLKKRFEWRRNDAQDCPDAIVDGILQRFTEKAIGSDERTMTTSMNRKLLSYIAVLCLIHDEFACPTVELAEDLQEDTKRVHEIFRSLGCKLEKLPAAELAVKLEMAKGNPQEIKRVEKERVARLVVPLVFPEPQRKRQKR